jgi:hypothetical protein
MTLVRGSSLITVPLLVFLHASHKFELHFLQTPQTLNYLFYFFLALPKLSKRHDFWFIDSVFQKSSIDIFEGLPESLVVFFNELPCSLFFLIDFGELALQERAKKQ